MTTHATTHTQRLSSRYPGLFIILLDQSPSMDEVIYDGGQSFTKAEVATSTLNDLILEMTSRIEFDSIEGKWKTYAYLSIWGYNDTAYPLSPHNGEPVDLPYLKTFPLGQAPYEKEVKDPKTGIIQVLRTEMPFWVKPETRGNTTKMAEAFKKAREIARSWIAAHPKSFPPVIINITDAQNTGNENPVVLARSIQSEGTEQGNMLIFNCHFSTQSHHSCIFPSFIEEVKDYDPPFAAQMFEMSSVIPISLLKKATEVAYGRSVPSGARSLVYNADSSALIKFLRWGTIGTAFRQ